MAALCCWVALAGQSARADDLNGNTRSAALAPAESPAPTPSPTAPPSATQALAQPPAPPAAPPALPPAVETPADTGVTRIAVLGDSLADGIWGGLLRAFGRDRSFELLRRARNGTGLSRPDIYDWPKGVGEILDKEHPNIAVIVIGLNDRQDTFANGHREYGFRSESWRRSYVERVDAVLTALAKHKTKAFWIGLPIMRDDAVSRDAQYLNGIYADATAKANVPFISWWDLSADENHHFASYLKVDDGRIHLARSDDGMHFTPIGYDQLAKPLAKMIRATAVAHAASSE